MEVREGGGMRRMTRGVDVWWEMDSLRPFYRKGSEEEEGGVEASIGWKRRREGAMHTKKRHYANMPT